MAVFIFLLHLAVSRDIRANNPDDNYRHVSAKVQQVSSKVISDENSSPQEYYDVELYIKVSESLIYDHYVINDIPAAETGKLDIGSNIMVKYDDTLFRQTRTAYTETVPIVFEFDPEPEPHYRTVLYIILSAGIIASLGAAIFSVRFAQRNEFLKNRKKWLEEHPNDDINNTEQFEYTAAGGYKGFDGKDENADLNPFGGSDMDYTSMYEYEQKLKDASYSAEGTYSGYGNEADNGSGGPSFDPNASYNNPNNPTDTQYDPAAPYSGYGGSNNTDTQYDPTAPYTGYVGSNNMDTQYDPTVPYSGYVGTNNMDTQYDPFAPYTGYDK